MDTYAVYVIYKIEAPNEADAGYTVLDIAMSVQDEYLDSLAAEPYVLKTEKE